MGTKNRRGGSCRSIAAVVGSLLVLAWGVPPPAGAEPFFYLFTDISRLGDGVPEGCDPKRVSKTPSINNNGLIVFAKKNLQCQGSESSLDVVTISRGGDGQSLAQISSFVNLSLDLEQFAMSLNNEGDVAWTFSPREVEVRKRSDGLITTIAKTFSGASLLPFPTPDEPFSVVSINESGTVAFSARIADSPVRGEAIFTGTGGPTTKIEALFSFSRALQYRAVQINNKGTVAFKRVERVNSVLGSWIVLYLPSPLSPTGFVPRVVASTEGVDGFKNLGDQISLNDSDTVAFTGTLANGVEGVFTSSGGPITTVADSTGPFRTFMEPSINAAGRVAFRARMDGDFPGIFIGPDPVLDRVVGYGDRLGNRAVRSLALGPEGLNDLGELAF